MQLREAVRSVIGLMAFLSVGSAVAQTTGADALEIIRADLDHNTEYRVERDPALLRVVDAVSGRELFRVVAISSDVLSIQGDVAHHIPIRDRESAREHIVHFNCSAAVGTLTVDRAERVLLQHYVNPAVVSPLAISMLAQRFGDAIRLESRTLLSQ